MKDEDIAAAPQSLVIRSLRRRLWQSLELQNVTDALRVYRATRAHWEQIMREERITNKRNPLLLRSIRIPTRSSPSKLETNLTIPESVSSDSREYPSSLLTTFMNPSEPFSLDDYLKPDAKFDPPNKSHRTFFSRKPSDTIPVAPDSDPRMTTPLHEAARLGSAELVTLMLQHGGDPNVRNGQGRTVLHMVSGGTLQGTAGIAPSEAIHDDANKKAANVVGRIFHKNEEKKKSPHYNVQEREFDRIEAALAILSWVHPVDGSDRSGEGPSINAVDSRGRTALHYAAELGREEIAMAIASTFGAMLTVVDDAARTPCELAAEHGHNELAAKLEARALLYIDPYGMDEELLASVSSVEHNECKPHVPPFCWFETIDTSKAQEERERRVDEVFTKMEKTISLHIEGHDAKKALLSGSDDDSESETAKKCSKQEELLRKLEFDDLVGLEQFHSINRTHAQMFLTYHKWNVRKSLLAFFESPTKSFQEAGIPLSEKVHPVRHCHETVCLICCDTFDVDSKDWFQLTSCTHEFCRECMQDYLEDCAKSKETGLTVMCPHHECEIPMKQEELVSLVSNPDVYASLLETTIENFVISAEDMRFCPYPGCGGIVTTRFPASVKKNGYGGDLLDTVGAICTSKHSPNGIDAVTYEGAIDPKYFSCESCTQPWKTHRFCYACGSREIHWPVTCDHLDQWKNTIQEHIKEIGAEDSESDERYQDIAQKLWMKTNTRPCPKCKAPIEKNEGCNHMTCSNPQCKHEFCWICRKDWKLHSTETGGFFRCNRWVDQEDHAFYDEPPEESRAIKNLTNEDLSDPRTMEATYGTAMHEARVSRMRSHEMDRFLHHYQRWSAHKESAALERNMGDTACGRLVPVIEAAREFTCDPFFNFGGKGLSFIHSAFTELLECRSMLQHSYAFSFFRYKSTRVSRYKISKRHLTEKLIFEQLQSELETMTEQISDVVARSHLRATQSQITYLTAAAAEKRKQFSNLVINIFIEVKKAQKKLQSNRMSEDKKRHSIGKKFERLLQGTYQDQEEFSENNDRRSEVLELGEEAEMIMSQVLRERMANYLPNTGDDSSVEEVLEEEVSSWACSACTYVNSHGIRCAMCGTSRL